MIVQRLCVLIFFSREAVCVKKTRREWDNPSQQTEKIISVLSLIHHAASSLFIPSQRSTTMLLHPSMPVYKFCLDKFVQKNVAKYRLCERMLLTLCIAKWQAGGDSTQTVAKGSFFSLDSHFKVKLDHSWTVLQHHFKALQKLHLSHQPSSSWSFGHSPVISCFQTVSKHSCV